MCNLIPLLLLCIRRAFLLVFLPFIFLLSPLPSVRPGLFLFFFFFFVSSLMPCFHVTTSFPHPSYASMVEAGVFCCGLGRYRSIWFGSGRYIEQFTDTTTGVCEGFLTLFHGSFFFFCTIQYLALRDARDVPTSQSACFWKWSRSLRDSAVFVPTYLLSSRP